MMFAYIKHILFFLLFFTYTSLADEVRDHEYKLELTPQWYTINHFVIQGPIGVSNKVSDYERKRYYVRPSIAYGFNDAWSARLGMFAAYNSIEELPNIIETRPYLGINYFYEFTDTFENMSISTYFRVEDRIKYNTDTWDHEQNWRNRLRVWGIYDLNPTSQEDSWHRVIVGAELLKTYFNKNEREIGVDENFEVETRLSLAVERIFKDNQKIRFDLSWRYQVPFDEIKEAKFSTFVFRIRYYPVWGDILKNILFRNVDE